MYATDKFNAQSARECKQKMDGNTNGGEVRANARPASSMGIVYCDDDWALAVISPMKARGLLTISRYDEPDSASPDGHGYQRHVLQGGKVTGIAHYLLEHLKVNGHRKERPTALVIAVRGVKSKKDISDFIRMFNAGDWKGLLKRFGDRVLSIIDGQHRHLGTIEATRLEPDYNPMMPVVLYFDIDITEEADQFDIINTNQTRLPKSLVEWNTLRITGKDKTDYAQDIRVITQQLGEDKDAPFARIGVNVSGARDPGRHITFEGLRRSTSNMLPAMLLKRIGALGKDPLDVAKTYWNLVADVCAPFWIAPPEKSKGKKKGDEPKIESRLVELVGIAAVSRLGQDIIGSSIEHPVPIDRMKQLVEPLGQLDWGKHSQDMAGPQAGFAGQKDLYNRLYAKCYGIAEAA